MSNYTKTARFIAACCLLIIVAAKNVAQEISFNRDISSILSDRCFKCHGPDADNQDSSFRLDTFENATEDLGGYAGIVSGDLENSLVHERIRSDDEGDRMPPPDALRQLTDAEKDLLDRWIKQGAPYEGHWSFSPIPEQVAVPAVGDDWAHNEIDKFVFERLEKNGLPPNQATSKEKWLRHVTFDLTGLPPTLAELDAFLQDDSPQAFGPVVDRLLASDASAERLTTEWLDVARYSDSYGFQRDKARYVWPYRDWVIAAFKKNMPYDQFITWQLAGDLLPNATREQIVATTFCRLHSQNEEGGVALEEFRVENVADRTQTFAAALMGLTMECCRCHDHKYDPIKTKEYYQVGSFFANIDERGLISYFTDAVPTPAIPLPTPEQEKTLASALQEIAAAEKNLKTVEAQAQTAFESWLKDLANSKTATSPPEILPNLVARLSFDELIPRSDDVKDKKLTSDQMRGLENSVAGTKTAWTEIGNHLVDGYQGKAIALNGDDSVVLPEIGHYERDQPFSISLWIKPSELTERALLYRHSRGWDDAGSIGYELVKLNGKLSAKLVHFWPGDAICVETDSILEQDKWQHVVVTYDGSSTVAGLAIYFNGQPTKRTVVQDHLTRNITKWSGGEDDLAIGARFRDRGFKGGAVDEFRVFERELSPIEAVQLCDGVALQDLLTSAGANLQNVTTDQRQSLQQYYLAAISETVANARTELQQARQKWNAAMDATPALTVMREQLKPRRSYVLQRGVYDQRGEEVTAGTPAFLPPFPADAPRNRLGLAQWVMSADHPLTARVAVNRYWQLMFGHGLVRTPEDFGLQGEPPSHPELLDWLARDFVDHGWDVRRLLRQMALSATYRQSAIVDPERREKDPENRLLSRGTGQRLSAEMIRDNVLAVSGVLDSQIGGPPVKPYDVALAYTPLPVDAGNKLYRRSLYTFWKRTSPAPVMIAMDSGTREVCRLKRVVTDSPLQALVLMNGTQFVEASRQLGAKLLQKHGDETVPLVTEAFRLLTSRAPSDEELAILTALYQEQLAAFEAEPKQAAELIGVGESEVPAGISLPKVAAATVLVNSILNLDESVRQR